MRPYLHVADVARILGVSEATLRRWDKAGTLPSLRDSRNGYRLYTRAGVARFIALRSGHHVALSGSRDELIHHVVHRLQTERWVRLVGPPGCGKSWIGVNVARSFENHACIDTMLDSSVAERIEGLRRGGDEEFLLYVEESPSIATEYVREAVDTLLGEHASLRVVSAGVSHGSGPWETVEVGYLELPESRSLLRALSSDEVSLITIAEVCASLGGHVPWLRFAAELLREDPKRAAPDVVQATLRAEPDESVRPHVEALPTEAHRALEALSTSSFGATTVEVAHATSADVVRADEWIRALETRSLVFRQGARYVAYEPVRRWVARRTEPMLRRRFAKELARTTLEHVAVERVCFTRDHATRLVELATSAEDREITTHILRAIPPWTLSPVLAPVVHDLLEALGEHLPRLRAEVSALRGDYTEASALLRDVLADDPSEASEILVRLAHFARLKGDFVAVSELLSPEVVASMSDPHRAFALRELGVVQLLSGLGPEAAPAFREVERIASAHAMNDLRSAAVANQAIVFADLGDFPAALHAAEQAFALATDDRGRAIAIANVAMIEVELGFAARARASLAVLAASIEHAADRRLRAFGERVRGWIAAEEQRPDEVDRHFHAAAELLSASEDSHQRTRTLVERSLCLLATEPARAYASLAEDFGESAAPSTQAMRDALLRVLRRDSMGWRAPEEIGLCRQDELVVELLDLAAGRMLDGAKLLAPLRNANRWASTRRALASVLRFEATAVDLVAVDSTGSEALSPARIDLSRRRTAGRVLVELVRSFPHGLTTQELLERAWPDERLTRDRAAHRAHSAVQVLRTAGVPVRCDGGVYVLSSRRAFLYELDGDVLTCAACVERVERIS